LLAESPEKTEPLSDLEHMVYGAVNQRVAENWVSFDLGFLEHIRPLEQRSVKATASYDPHAVTCAPIIRTTINGQAAILERSYVQTDERGLKPKVLYIDIFGKSIEGTHGPVRARITP